MTLGLSTTGFQRPAAIYSEMNNALRGRANAEGELATTIGGNGNSNAAILKIGSFSYLYAMLNQMLKNAIARNIESSKLDNYADIATPAKSVAVA